MRLLWAVSPTLFLTLLAGCSSSPEREPSRAEPAPAVTPVSTPPSPSTSPSPAAESTGPPPTTGPVHQLGDRVRLVTGSDMTVFSWHRARRPGPPGVGAWWAGDVKFCVSPQLSGEEPIGNLRSQFRAELPDGSPLTPEGDARRPDEVYAAPGAVVVGGKCLRGKVVFDVPTGQEARYFAATVSSFGWVRWQLS